MAGCSAGIVSVLALQPLDVIKTRLQGGGPALHTGVGLHPGFACLQGSTDSWICIMICAMPARLLLQSRMVFAGSCRSTGAPGMPPRSSYSRKACQHSTRVGMG